MTEADEKEDQADPQMDRLLKVWGAELRKSIGTGAEDASLSGVVKDFHAFPPPAPLETLRKRIAEAQSKQTAQKKRWLYRIWSRRRSRFAAAASVAAAIGIVWAAARWWERPGQLELSDVFLSSTQGETRGAGKPSFRTLDKVFIHLRLSAKGWVFVAEVDARKRFLAISQSPEPMRAGKGTLGSFELDDQTGTEAFVILFTGEALPKKKFHAMVEEADREVPSDLSHADRTQAIAEHLRKRHAVGVEVVSFEHLPRRA